MATRDPAETEARVRRRFRRAILSFAVLAAVSGLGTLVTYVQAWDLLNGDTRPVVGTVVDERKGFLGIRNLVTVEYELGSERYQAEIPVKGDGFRGPRIRAYFYERGDRVELLVAEGDESKVRTKDRWIPAVYNWAVVLVFSLVIVPFLALLRAVIVS